MNQFLLLLDRKVNEVKILLLLFHRLVLLQSLFYSDYKNKIASKIVLPKVEQQRRQKQNFCLLVKVKMLMKMIMIHLKEKMLVAAAAAADLLLLLRYYFVVELK